MDDSNATAAPKRTRSSLNREGSVAQVLNELEQNVIEQMMHKLAASSDLLLADEVIAMVAKLAGHCARKAAGTALGQAFQLGVNRAAQSEDYERPTKPPAK